MSAIKEGSETSVAEAAEVETALAQVLEAVNTINSRMLKLRRRRKNKPLCLKPSTKT